MHISPSGKKYVGITSQKPPYKRWGRDGRGYKGQAFYNAIKKYGWDNIHHLILYENLTEKEAYKIEIGLINIYNTRNSKHGYNVTIGGQGSNGHVMSEEGKERLRQLYTGRKLTEKWRLKVIEGLKNRNPDIYKNVIEKTIGKNNKNSKKVDVYDMDGNFIETYTGIRDASRKYNLDFKNVSACCRGEQKSVKGYRIVYHGEKLPPLREPSNLRAVDRYDLDGNYIDTYESISEAAKALGLGKVRSHITSCCKGKRRSCGGFIWKYSEDNIKEV
jgi:group I intron endonuclease